MAEIAFAVLLPASRSFTRLWPTIGIALAAPTSLWLLTRAMLTIPGSTAYTIWVAAGAAGAVIVPYLLGGPRPTLVQLCCTAVIIGAVAILKTEAS